jgi:hypothetical protein
LIDGGQVAAGLCIAHGRKTVLLHGIRLAVFTTSGQSRNWLISWDGGNRLLRYQGELKTLEFIKPLTDILITDRVKLAASDLTKEVVKSFIPSLACLVIVKGSLGSRGVGVVGNGTITRMRGSLVVVLGLIVLSRLVAGVVALTRDHGLSVVAWCCQKKVSA